MFKDIIDSKYRENINKIDWQKDEYSFNEIINNFNIDSFTINFLKAELDWWLYEDKLLRTSNKSFNFMNIDQNINNEIDKIYKQNAKVSEDELKSLIRKAVVLEINFLILPNNTLRLFVFSNSVRLSSEEYKLKLNYFAGYEYLIEQLNILDEVEFVDRIDFEQALLSLEKQNLVSLNLENTAKIFKNLFNNFSNEKELIHRNIVELFLEDKFLYDISNGLKIFLDDTDLEFISIEDIMNFFEAYARSEVDIPENTF